MRFNLVDRIIDFEPAKHICVEKHLTLGEEYLADHFPSFPVMPGVLMLQCLVEAGAWLLRLTEDFRHSIICLRELKNVKYGNFVQPGQTLHVTMEATDYAPENGITTFKGNGTVDGTRTVSARLMLHRYRLADRQPEMRETDERLRKTFRQQYLTIAPQDLSP